MTATEEGGKVATAAVMALQSTPVFMVMVILNIFMICAAAWYLDRRQHDSAGIVQGLVDKCFVIRDAPK